MEKIKIKKKQDSSTTLDSEIDDMLIDVERISIGKNQADNIQCFLCFRVPFSPMLIECCDQIICNGCLKMWKEKKSICPHCREANFKAIIPNKFIKRIYSDIKYFCIFKEKGCTKDDLSYDQIHGHEETCQYNPSRIIQCNKCDEKFSYDLKSEHNCVKELCRKNDKLKKKIVELEKKIKNLEESKKDIFEIGGLAKEYSYLSHTLKLHRHILVKTKKKNKWRCNGCSSTHVSSQSYYCFECDIDLCLKCYQISTVKDSQNYNHPHELSVKDLGEHGFNCDNCRGKNEKLMLRFRCKPCDFDICFKCRY